MSAVKHTLFLLVAAVAAFIWLHIPLIEPYSLQAFVIAMIAYFLVKHIKKTRFWTFAPQSISAEMTLLTFAILLLIGFTGGTSSLLFALSYIYLFLLVFAVEATAAIAVTMLLVLYYYALALNPAAQDYVNLITLPVMTFFFLFAKTQYEQANQERIEAMTGKQKLADSRYTSHQLQVFMEDFLKPKLEYLITLLSHPEQNQKAIQGQLTLLQVEIEKMVRRCETEEAEEKAQELLENTETPKDENAPA